MMSTHDNVKPLLSAPWRTPAGAPVAYPLPGLGPEALRALSANHPAKLSPSMRRWLAQCCGIAGKPLGDKDFTGNWCPEEPLSVLRPALTLVVEPCGRRCIAERGTKQRLPGPIWRVLESLAVVLRMCENLAGFVRLLWEHSVKALAQQGHYAAIHDVQTLIQIQGFPHAIPRHSCLLKRCGSFPIFALLTAADVGNLSRWDEAGGPASMRSTTGEPVLQYA